ncbi:helix-turn-helix domain-containing protein [Nocardioides sp. BP30]|uniref:winged helix-turn-helix transcriptional regulator n=1 Tax=Nocardioides sp. BP30 TaxID=3036374 RepID=UPI0024696041|nr:helix-turn-helix domain-containing protein [Nocardioides sp. BP30]WGL53289.1 helix-turn-helix domain-containing protein [Nocardioides sp. BP30]
MASYGQFCPMAKAMEVLDERWTLLVVRELLLGSTHFNELRRGVPKMSPALLSKRLRTLERAGVITRRGSGQRTSYHLTASGQELEPVVRALQSWGTRWVGELGQEDLDPHLLFWDLRRTLHLEEWPRRRTVVAFLLTDVEPRVSHWWLVVSAEGADVCDFDPGYPVDATVRTPLRLLTRVWRGDCGWTEALSGGQLDVLGTREMSAALPRWIGQSSAALVPRPRGVVSTSAAH